jgi:hypothetical protein
MKDFIVLKKLATLRRYLYYLSLLLVPSCSNSFDINYSKDGYFYFTRKGIIFSSRFSPCLKTFSVYGSKKENLLWSISAKNGKCFQASLIYYGQKPINSKSAFYPKMINSEKVRAFATDSSNFNGFSQEILLISKSTRTSLVL